MLIYAWIGDFLYFKNLIFSLQGTVSEEDITGAYPNPLIDEYS